MQFPWGRSERSGDVDPAARAEILRMVFSPANPVRRRDLFSGRSEQLERVLEAIDSRGRHVILFGERGVGKTSLANIVETSMAAVASEPVTVMRVNCDAADDFSTLWRKLLADLRPVIHDGSLGFARGGWQRVGSLVQRLVEEPFGPDDVRRVLAEIAKQRRVLVIIDEFERPRLPAVATGMTDLIKSLADQDVPVTLLLVGVGASVDRLLAEHASVARSLVQVEMPRMSDPELRGIVVNGLRLAAMTIPVHVLNRIVLLSKGYPYYTHQLAARAAQYANEDLRDQINESDVDRAIQAAVADAQHSIATDYERAVRSHRRGNRYVELLLACALARVDDRTRSFAPADVSEALRQMGRASRISGFSQYLKEFGSSARGHVLEQTGDPRRYRYRLRDPLFGPYVVMRGLAEGRIQAAALTLALPDEP